MLLNGCFHIGHVIGPQALVLIGLRLAVLARGFASGKYSNPQVSTAARGPVTGQCEKNPFHDIFINQRFVLNF